MLRPALLALLAAVLATGGRFAPRIAAVLLVAVLLPLPAYAQNLARLGDGEAPLRTLRDCLLKVQVENGGSAGFYVDVPDPEMAHAAYYYFRRVQPWRRAESASVFEILPYVADPNRFQLVLIAKSRYDRLVHSGFDPPLPDYARAVPIVSFDDLDVLLPGPFGACRPTATTFKTSR